MMNYGKKSAIIYNGSILLQFNLSNILPFISINSGFVNAIICLLICGLSSKYFVIIYEHTKQMNNII